MREKRCADLEEEAVARRGREGCGADCQVRGEGDDVLEGEGVRVARWVRGLKGGRERGFGECNGEEVVVIIVFRGESNKGKKGSNRKARSLTIQ